VIVVLDHTGCWSQLPHDAQLAEHCSKLEMIAVAFVSFLLEMIGVVLAAVAEMPVDLDDVDAVIELPYDNGDRLVAVLVVAVVALRRFEVAAPIPARIYSATPAAQAICTASHQVKVSSGFAGTG
jgi:hypothetical protein